MRLSLGRAGGLLLAVGVAVSISGVFAQEARPVFDTNPNLSEQEKRGKHLFLQRCSICHLSHYSKSNPAAFPPNSGVSLTGILKGAPPEKEKSVREFIMKGTTKMPGFQYGLQPKDFDELIAYLKTL
jgi:mono/diheme cytochrome c family protein